MSGGISSTNLIYFELFSFKYGRITLKFQKLSEGHCPQSAILGSAPALDPMCFTKHLELIGRELTTPIDTKGLQLGLSLNLGCYLHDLERLQSLILPLQQHNPHVSIEIVDDEQEILVPDGHRRHDWSTQVAMDQLKNFACSILLLPWKWGLPLFPSKTTVAQLLNMIDTR
jgi:hypothetical protein